MEEQKFYGYILEQFTLDGTSKALVRNIQRRKGKTDGKISGDPAVYEGECLGLKYDTPVPAVLDQRGEEGL